MRLTRNVTLAIPEESYRRAKIHAALHGMSLSSAVSYLLQHLPVIDQAVRKLVAEPDFGAPAGSSSCPPDAENFAQKIGCETVNELEIIENKSLESRATAASQKL